MPKITILCPYHGVTEELELPESYGGSEGNFQGEVPCGFGSDREWKAILNIEISQWKIRRIGLLRMPDRYPGDGRIK